jgi:hypothetical protein
MVQWSGKLIDANGRVGTINLDLPDKQGEGQWTVELAERDGAPVPLHGKITVDGDLAQTPAELRGTDRFPEGDDLTWIFRVAPAPAGDYARSAAIGQYTIEAGEARRKLLPLSGGVVTLWLFE